MKSRCLATILCATTILLPGCTATQDYFEKPWGVGTYGPAALCALVGAGVGIGVAEAVRGESSASVTTGPVGSQTTTFRSRKDDADYYKGAIPAAIIGAVLCGLVGHATLDPPLPSPPPPPPPTPSPTPAPPAPSSRRIVLRGVNFDFDQDTIRPDSRPILNAAVRILNENPAVRIAVEGHTDSIGSEEYNEQLSLRRAEVVYRYLVNHGVDPERLEVVGYGESRPVASNEDAGGRAQNRRTELHVVNDGAPANGSGAAHPAEPVPYEPVPAEPVPVEPEF
jgi:outer membrane protein OmpA-like peptidoglycan-associated protein